MIKCTIWKLGDALYRITIGDIRYRYLDTACITEIDILFECMEDIAKELKEKGCADTIFEIVNTKNIACK